MAANTSPIFPLTPNVSWVAVGGAANTNSDGTGTIGTNIYKAFTAGANGSYIYRVRLSPVATTAATATAATVLRLYISSITSGSTTQTNTMLFAEVAAAAQTADQTTIATNYLEVVCNFIIPASYTVLISSHIVNNASTSWTGAVWGGDY